MPLYGKVKINYENSEKIEEFINSYDQIEVYCIFCKKERVFKLSSSPGLRIGMFNDNDFEILSTKFKCGWNEEHQYIIFFKIEKDEIEKIGQTPSVADFQIPQAQKYREILGKRYKELTKGIGLAANGVGIGSFVYLRRIFENLIEEAYNNVKKLEGFDETAYQKSRMDEKIQILKDYLPPFLVENRKLYSILSIGIHELSEEECLRYFEVVRVAIEVILDQKIEQNERGQREIKAKKILENITQEIVKQSTTNVSV